MSDSYAGVSRAYDPESHWEKVYEKKGPTEVSWFQYRPEKSLELILKMGLSPEAEIIDVGGGASTLVDFLLAKGFKHITVLDVSRQALRESKQRIGKFAREVTWIEADITRALLPEQTYDLWHDRALFHFLTRPEDRRKYAAQMRRSLKPNGHLIIATFSLDGPDRCSGLEVVRYSPETMGQEFGAGFTLMESLNEDHRTPHGAIQKFVYAHFQRRSA